MDRIWHRPDKTHISREAFDRRLREILQKDRWILDGNYQRTLKTRLLVCDTVFLLDYPAEVCLAGAAARVGTQRTDLPWAETELDGAFRQQILDFSQKQRPEIYDLLEKQHEGKSVFILKSRAEADAYLRRLAALPQCEQDSRLGI